MKICPVGAELFHAGGRTDRHEEAIVSLRSFTNGIISGISRLEEIRSVVSNHGVRRNNSRLFTPHKIYQLVFVTVADCPL